MNSKVKSILFFILIASLIALGVVYQQSQKNILDAGAETQAAAPNTEPTTLDASSTPSQTPTEAPSPTVSGEPSPQTSLAPNPGVSPQATMTSTLNSQPDLSVDSNGLSKATVVMTTTQGVIKYKFYPKDAPNTVHRIIELINQGFYNNLTFHRVVRDFVIQGGDPQGTGIGGSGQKLKAEFNERRHIEGTVAMARSQDPNSADSQFYISLGTHPHLDRNYTVFGQVIEGMDVAKKIKVGDKMTLVKID